jgi:hypothetical protein
MIRTSAPLASRSAGIGDAASVVRNVGIFVFNASNGRLTNMPGGRRGEELIAPQRCSA